MRRGVLLTGLATLLGAVGLARGPSTLPSAPNRDFSRAPAVEVGDVRAGNVVTVQLAGEQRQLRLIGVFTPAAGTEEDAARAYLWNLLRGERVFVEYEADWPLKDREGRYWAYVYRAPDGLFVNLELIRLGLARLSAPEPFEFKAVFEVYEDHARRAEKGLWAAPAADEASATRPAEPTSRPAPPPETRPAPPTADDTVTVYATKSGTRYHTADCRHAKGAGAVPISLRETKARGLTPCSVCKPPQ
jgi:endonuclease YncB( thermonuclease family)